MPIDSGTSTVCPLCGASGASCVRPGVEPGDGYAVRYCRRCDLSFSEPMRSADRRWYESSGIYSAHKSSPQKDLVRAAEKKGMGDWRAAKMFDILAHGPVPDGIRRILDAGCGDGRLVAAASAQGWDAHGFDINSDAVRKASAGSAGAIISGDINDMGRLPYARESFDAISMFDVLEHAASPLTVVSAAADMLKPGGAIFISVPNLNRFPGFFDDEIDAPPHHLTLWSPKALRTVLSRAGLVNVEVFVKPHDADELVFHIVRKLKRFMRRASVGRPPSAGSHPAGRAQFSGSHSVFRKTGWFFLNAAGLVFSLIIRVTFPAGGFVLLAHGRNGRS
ncbi:MAG: class I SAM-dependent methyltransferase [Endomicrobiia bacterium]|nr:class I SAM-dependent methyltransferase [Endomicrobiia bacterium]